MVICFIVEVGTAVLRIALPEVVASLVVADSKLFLLSINAHVEMVGSAGLDIAMTAGVAG